MYIDIFLPIYNPGGIPGLQNTDSSIPDTGIEKRYGFAIPRCNNVTDDRRKAHAIRRTYVVTFT